MNLTGECNKWIKMPDVSGLVVLNILSLFVLWWVSYNENRKLYSVEYILTKNWREQKEVTEKNEHAIFPRQIYIQSDENSSISYYNTVTKAKHPHHHHFRKEINWKKMHTRVILLRIDHKMGDLDEFWKSQLWSSPSVTKTKLLLLLPFVRVWVWWHLQPN